MLKTLLPFVAVHKNKNIPMEGDSFDYELQPCSTVNIGLPPERPNDDDDPDTPKWDEPRKMPATKSLCPLCQSEMRLFFVNFNEKLLMCENVRCVYPFGYEDLQFVKLDSNSRNDEEIMSTRSNVSAGSLRASGSVLSTAAWSEIDRINNATYEAGVNQFDANIINNNEREFLENNERKIQERQTEQQILVHLKEIENLNKELASHTKDTDEKEVQLKNKKWIMNLRNIQQLSGVQMLKPEEMGLLRKEEPELGAGELKIDIDNGDSCMSSIKIQILNIEEEEINNN